MHAESNKIKIKRSDLLKWTYCWTINTRWRPYHQLIKIYWIKKDWVWQKLQRYNTRCQYDSSVLCDLVWEICWCHMQAFSVEEILESTFVYLRDFFSALSFNQKIAHRICFSWTLLPPPTPKRKHTNTHTHTHTQESTQTVQLLTFWFLLKFFTQFFFTPQFCTVRLYWAGDNLGYWDEFLNVPCPRCRINHLTCWHAVRCTTTLWLLILKKNPKTNHPL